MHAEFLHLRIGRAHLFYFVLLFFYMRLWLSQHHWMKSPYSVDLSSYPCWNTVILSWVRLLLQACLLFWKLSIFIHSALKDPPAELSLLCPGDTVDWSGDTGSLPVFRHPQVLAICKVPRREPWGDKAGVIWWMPNTKCPCGQLCCEGSWRAEGAWVSWTASQRNGGLFWRVNREAFWVPCPSLKEEA